MYHSERADIDIDYGYDEGNAENAPTEETEETIIYSRRVSQSMLFTVQTAIECKALSVIQPPSDEFTGLETGMGTLQLRSNKPMASPGKLKHRSSYNMEQSQSSLFRSEMRSLRVGGVDHCIVLVDVYNRADLALEFVLERCTSEGQNELTPEPAEWETQVSKSMTMRRLVPARGVER